MQLVNWLISGSVVLGGVAHATTETPPPTALTEKPARSSSRDIKVPRTLVQQLETEYRAYLLKNQGSDKAPIRRHLLNLACELTQTRPLALQEEVRVVAPVGGGVIDLSDFVTLQRGMFRMKLVVRLENDMEPEGLRIFFISDAKARVIEGEEFGSGCNKYMEITSYFNKGTTQKGFEVYTANQRYLSVLGGAFVAVSFTKEALWVGTLRVMDSRFPHLMCDKT